MTSFSELLAFVDAQEAKLAEAVGRFSMRFAELEGDLNWAIGCLLGTTDGRARVTMAAIRNVSTRLDIFAALASGIDMAPEVKARLRDCAAQIGDLNGYRNTLLHNKWGGNFLNADFESWTKIWTETSRRKSQRRSKTFTAAEIKARADECLRCRVLLSDGIKAYQEGGPLEQSEENIS